MQSSLLPLAPSASAQPALPSLAAVVNLSSGCIHRPFLRNNNIRDPYSFLSSFKLNQRLSSPFFTLTSHSRKVLASSPSAKAYTSTSDDSEKAKLAQVTKRLVTTSRHFKRLGSFGFWGQLLCTLVAAVILSFSSIVTGKITSPVTFYATAGGIAAAFVSVFWSFGYIRLSDRLLRSANDPSKAPTRAEVVKSLKNEITVNLLGMGAAVLGMLATVGSLVAKALTTSTNPYQLRPGSSPVLALDVFLVQASANTVLSHFLGLACSLELLRSVTMPESVPIPKIA